MKDPEKILYRINQSRDALHEYRRKCYRLRRLVAGDLDVLDDAGGDGDATNDRKRQHIAEFEDILVKNIEEGRSNKLLQTVRTLVFQTAARFPEIEFEDLDPDVAVVNAGYLETVLGNPPRGCGAAQQMRLALMDYLIDGVGWAYIGMDAGRPVVRRKSNLLMAWDLAAPTILQSRWASCTVYGTLGGWIELYGSKPFQMYINEKGDDPDRPIDLEYYYDIEGDGRHMVFLKTGEDAMDSKPVFDVANPCFFEIQGERVPFLPFEPICFMELPSVGLPVSLAEQMLPSQLALWEVEKDIRQTVGLPAFYDYEEGTYDADEEQKLEDGEPGTIMRRKASKNPPALIPGAEISSTTLDWRRYHEEELVSHGGANPYASGGKVEGVQYAAEVNAIQGAAGLMASTIAKDHADHWVRVVRKVLAMGKAYDEKPVTVLLEDVPSEFGPNFPIAPYLEPFADLVISEDSMQFLPREQRVAMALRDLETSIGVAQMFPNAAAMAFERYLRSRGEKNIRKWMEQPMAAPDTSAVA